MAETLRTAIFARSALSSDQYQEIVALCRRAYDEELSETLAMFTAATHVLGYLGAELVTHALWIPRTLIAGGQALHTAYVEAVATDPRYQRRGYASTILRAMAVAIIDYDLGALSPSDAAFYARLGWEEWRGPLAAMIDDVVMPTPGETAMILRLPATPLLDLEGTLVAPWRAGDIW